MTARTADPASSLRARLGVVVVALAATVLASWTAAPGRAAAGWASVAHLSTGTMGSATFADAFLPIGGGTGGGAYTSASLASPTVAYVDLRNDSSVRAVLSGTVTGQSLVSLLGTTVRVDTCTTAWRRLDGTCAGTESRQLPVTSLAERSPLTWATLEPGASTHAKLTVSGGVGVVVVVLATAQAAAARPAGDRTGS